MPAEFKMSRRVVFAETDMAGVMHFSNYFRWMEDVEHTFFRSIGFSVVQEIDGRTISWPRVSVGCEYKGPLRFEDEVEVHLILTNIGDKSVSYEAAFSCRGREVARGKTTMVCCEMKDGHFKSTVIPAIIRAKLEKTPG